jgi:hypothetical protein
MLDRQNIVVPLAQGVDTKTDEKQVEAGKLLELENGIFTRLRSIQKRPGSVALSQSIANTPGTQVETGIGLAKYGNELLEADGRRLYSYDQGADSWANKGSFVHTFVTQTPVIKDNYQQTMPDGATAANGTQLYAWEDSSAPGAVRYCIIDGQTQQTIVSNTLLYANASKPRVLVNDTHFLVYFVNGLSYLSLAMIPLANPTTAPVIHQITSLGSTDNALSASSANYDASLILVDPSTDYKIICVAFNNNNSGTTFRVYTYSSPLVIEDQDSVNEVSRTITIGEIYLGSFSNVRGPCLVYSTDNNSAPYTQSIKFRVYYKVSVLFVLTASGTITTGLTTDQAKAITVATNDYANIGFTVFYSTCTSTPQSMTKCVVDSSYTPGAQTLVLQNVTPIAKAFNYNGTAYVPVVYFYPGAQDSVYGDTATQSGIFLVDANGSVVGKAFADLSGNARVAVASYPGILSTPLLANSSAVNGSVFRLAVTDQVASEASSLVSQTNVSALTIDMDSEQHSLNHEELAQNLHLSSGAMQMYDGQSVVEHGFLTYPIFSITSEASGGNLGAGQYSYTICYEWTDNQGNIHQSYPASFKRVTPTAAGKSITLTVNYLNLTAKDGVQLVVYRTASDGTILYRTNSLTPSTATANGSIYNVPTGTTVTYTDSMSDADLERMPQLYTQPLEPGVDAVVSNQPAPPTGLIQLHRNRLWVVDSTNPLNVWYSKFIGPATPVAFSDEFVKTVDPRGGPITALATIDDKLLVFKYDQMFFIVGQGPENTGVNNDLSDAILITTDVGCIDPRSIVGSPFGILFKSRKGIYLIDRSLAVQYIGAAVEAYNDETITSATLVANTNQVRFTLGSGITLVYDYFVQQWGIFTNQNAVDSLVWQSSTMLLRANGKVLQETEGVYTDDGQPIRLKLATSWFSFANVQGFQRVRRAQLLGAWKSAHDLSISVCVDFDDTVIQQMTVSPTPPTFYGGGSPYGAGSYGGTFQLYQWRVDLARQKCQAVKFIIEDVPSVTGSGEGVSLSSLAFEVGAKQGLNKVPASQIVS